VPAGRDDPVSGHCCSSVDPPRASSALDTARTTGRGPGAGTAGPRSESAERMRGGRAMSMSMASLIALPPLLCTFSAARRTISGLTAGAVKG